MQEESIFLDELKEQVATLQDYFRDSTKSGTFAQLYGRLTEECRELSKNVGAREYRRATYNLQTIRRISTDSLVMEDDWLVPTFRIEKVLRILVIDVHCPYCNGYLRSAKARQCPECLTAWRDGGESEPAMSDE